MIDYLEKTIVRIITVVLGLLIIFIPLGIWKMVDIIIWIFK